MARINNMSSHHKRGMIRITTLFFALALVAGAGAQQTNRIVVLAGNPGAVISKDIYGHFSEHLGTCIYGGIWVGKDSKIPNTDGIRNDVLDALKEMRIPNLRWPGGCFADTYHWRDGVGPQEERASIVNIYWGGLSEDNSFGTHEFMRLTELLGCDAYINGNIGSGSVREMAEWAEYLTSPGKSPMTDLRKQNGREEPWKVKFFAIGNETWGCGGTMTAGYYSDLMRQYSTFLRDYGSNQLYRVACGPYAGDFKWTETLMKDEATRGMFQGLSIHYYTVVDGWGYKGSATRFDEREWFETVRLNLEMDDIIRKHEAVMDLYDPERTKGLVVDEWGNWFTAEPGTNPAFLNQQNSLRDAVSAAIYLNIFNNHAARVRVANLAQMVNVLQSVILTSDDRMVLTPTYHVFRMFRVHHDARLVPVDVVCENYSYGEKKVPALSVSASLDKDNVLHISLANLNPGREIKVSCLIEGFTAGAVTGEVLTAPAINSYNSFEEPENVRPVSYTDYKIKGDRLTITMPSKSVVVLEIKTGK